MISSELPTDEKILAAIGKIALRHGQLDHILRMTVKTITGVTLSEAMHATAKQGSRELRTRVRQLAKKRFSESDVLVKIDAILDRSRQATDKRNRLLHGLWAKHPEHGEVFQTEDLALGPPPTLQELEALVYELSQIASDLNVARLKGFLMKALKN